MTTRPAVVRVRVPGPRGPAGEVTPELEAARQEAVSAAALAESSASDAASAAGAADQARAQAGESAALSDQNRSEAQSARSAAQAARDAANASATSTAADRLAAETARAAASAAQGIAEVARTAAEAAATGAILVDTKVQLDANTTALVGQVLTGTDAGFYGRTSPGNAATPWLRRSTATLPSLDAGLASESAARRDLGARTAGYVVPLVGRPSDPQPRVAYNAAGELVRTEDDRGRIQRAGSLRTFVVPMTAGLSTATWSPTGVLLEGIPRDSRGEAVAIGAVEGRAAPGVVSGRSLQQVFLRRSEATFVPLTGGPYEAILLGSDGAAAQVKRLGQTQSVRWRANPIGTGGTLHLVLGAGRSLMQGHVDAGVTDRFPAWRDPVGERAWQFDGRAADSMERGPRPFQVAPMGSNRTVSIADAQLVGLAPLRGSRHATDATYHQTFAETCALALIGQHFHHRDEVLAAIVGTGSTPIADFAVGTAHMTSMQKVVTQASTFAGRMGKALRVWFVWNQGEEDNALGTTAATYKAAFVSMRNAVSAHVAGLSPAASFGGTFIHQCMNDAGTAMATTAHAELALAGEASIVPTFAMAPGWSGSTHMHPLSYLPLGCATAYAIAETYSLGALYQPPRVAAGNARLTSPTTVDCTFTGGSGSYLFDTTTIPDAADGRKGVTVVRGTAGAVTVASVAWLGASTLRVTTAEALQVSDDVRVRFGLYGNAGAALMPSAAAPRVNIRDDSAWPCAATGRIVSGWAMAHQVTVTAP